MKAAIRISLCVLWALLALYVASKIHFFRRYDTSGVGVFIRDLRYTLGCDVVSFSP